ncbi:TetR/AcrR family transcriptional regulator [Corallococcus macrosporus]|uniref:TetR family transcriptional regulator n=1 Tax=Corallococcus macrosporus DSM 14697 TaxID=1189310 RepID=A0A250K4N0_9BACT|nr:TetR/AcrR family transcriptional regulator [Corallococcus macrosporus]ATB50286.1 TetR family transcriptional regulator [Corallococcus macrosporus DSM 14697]
MLDATIAAIQEGGPTGLSLRELARRAGVSHAALTHHFADKAGLLTALAEEGYTLLADELAAERERSGDFVELGVAYVRFAIKHRAHFEVMHRPDLYNRDDSALAAAQARAEAALHQGLSMQAGGRPGKDVRLAALAAWSLVHGFASLWLNGMVPSEYAEDPDASARAIAELLIRKG